MSTPQKPTRRPAHPTGGQRAGFDKKGPAADRKTSFSKGKPEFGSSNGKPGFGKDSRKAEFGKDSRKPEFGSRKPVPGRKPVNAPTAPTATDGMPARRLALKVIRQVTEEGAYASLALDAALRNCGLISADRRLVSRLVYDTLDRLIWLDWTLGQVMAKEDTDIRLRNILRLGACQLLLEDRIPESAATNTSVKLCEELGMEGLKGVCNGILRNLIRKKDELTFPDPETEPDKAKAIAYSLPEWLWVRLREEYGEEAEKIAGWKNRGESWTLRPNGMKITDGEFEALLGKKVWEKRRADLPGAWKITGAIDIAADGDFREGKFSIQTEGSMIACLAMAPKRGQKILDCCAAPGGKTCYMAEMMNGTGRVQAWDIHDHRVALIEAQARRLGLENIRPMVRDATKRREDLDVSLDGVLLDAPCTGLGMLAEKPDIKLRVTPESLAELTALQRTMLDTVCAYVRPGGTLVYSTCSILKEENGEQTEDFLRRHPDFERIELPETIPEKYRQYAGPDLQLLPHRDGTEGFYVCRMRRKA